MTLVRRWMPSPNYSSRGGSTVRLIVLHTAEGATTIESLGNFFASSSSGVSSHAGADDTPNTVGEYVNRSNKAWTAANANPVAVQIELCAFAAWSASDWDAHPNMLANTAAWIAEEAAAFGIPITKLSSSDAQGGAAGVCQHADLGSWGGGHWDCGPAFPIDHVLDLAHGTQPAPTAPASSEDSTMAIVTAPGRVDLFVVGTDHHVYQATGVDQTSLARSRWQLIGGDKTYAKAVSAAWTPDYTQLYLTVQGSDDHPYICRWDNVGGGWSNFDGNTDGLMSPDPYA